MYAADSDKSFETSDAYQIDGKSGRRTSPAPGDDVKRRVCAEPYLEVLLPKP